MPSRPARLEPVLRRLRGDFRLAILTLFGLVACLAILPFAVFRFVQGEWLVGTADSLIVLGLAALVAYAWRSGNIERACLGAVAVYTFGGLLVARLLAPAGTLWLYPVLLTNFLLVNRRLALAASLFTLAMTPLASPPERLIDAATLLVTGAMVCTFSFIFAYRTDTQREQLEHLACHDPLTGAYNRRALERELCIALEGHRRYSTPHGLAVLDIDHFKRINDRYGHEAGDSVLMDFTQLLHRQIRTGDRLFRAGGEEFVLLLPGTTREGLLATCEKLRAKVAEELRSTASRSPSRSAPRCSRPTPRPAPGWHAPTPRCTGPSTAAATGSSSPPRNRRRRPQPPAEGAAAVWSAACGEGVFGRGKTRRMRHESSLKGLIRVHPRESASKPLSADQRPLRRTGRAGRCWRRGPGRC